MIIENFGIAEFFGITFIGFPVLLYLIFALLEGISDLVNFFRFSNRRFRIPVRPGRK